jgi:tetratricopeptide (TPR) repeat protein
MILPPKTPMGVEDDESIPHAVPDALAAYKRGMGWGQKKDYDKAIKEFDAAIRIDPNYPAALVGRGFAWHNKQEMDKAIRDYNEAIRLDPTYVDAFAARGCAWHIKREFDKAIEDYDEAIRLDPGNGNTFFNRGTAWGQIREHDKAIKDLNEAIRLDPNDALAFFNRGTAWAEKKEVENAIKDYDEGIRLNPNDARAFRTRANAWICKKGFDKAVRDYSEAIRLDPKDSWARFSRSVAQMLMRRPESAKGFQEVIDVDGWTGKRTPYAVILGNLAARQAQDEPAGKRFLEDAAGKLDEAWPYPIVRFLRGEIDEAALLALATDHVKRTEAHCYLGLDLALKGRKDEALAYFRLVRYDENATFIEFTIALAGLDRLELPPKKP